MCELLSLNQKISSLSENLEKAVNDMKVQDKNVDLLHENIKILQNEQAQKNEIIKSLMEIQSCLEKSPGNCCCIRYITQKRLLVALQLFCA